MRSRGLVSLVMISAFALPARAAAAQLLAVEVSAVRLNVNDLLQDIARKLAGDDYELESKELSVTSVGGSLLINKGVLGFGASAYANVPDVLQNGSPDEPRPGGVGGTVSAGLIFPTTSKSLRISALGEGGGSVLSLSLVRTGANAEEAGATTVRILYGFVGAKLNVDFIFGKMLLGLTGDFQKGILTKVWTGDSGGSEDNSNHPQAFSAGIRIGLMLR